MKPNIKKLLILNAPYLLFVYLFDKVGQAVRLSPGAGLSGKLLSIGSGFSAAFSNALPSFAPMDLLIGIVGAVVIRLAVYVKGKNAKKYRKGMEYGSARWGNAEDTIVGNCDTTLFLGGKEKTTLKEMSEILGKETIDSFNTSETRGRELSHGLNYQKLGKQLMSEDEIAVMDGGKCILQLRGVRPFFSEKYDITKHPKYKYLSDFDKKNAFDMEKHLRRRPAIVKPDEVFDYYEVDEADLQEDAE